MRVCGYVRVSKDSGTGLSLSKQRWVIRQAVEARDWRLMAYEEEMGSTRKKRPTLERVLRDMGKHKYDVLMVARLDRLARSSLEFQEILAQSDKQGWKLVILDPPVDTTTPFGKAMAGMAAIFAELERDLISKRTREALDAKRARGEPTGAPRTVPDRVYENILRWTEEGKSSNHMARRLNAIDPRPVPWTGGLVRAMRKTARYRELVVSKPVSSGDGLSGVDGT